ATLTLAAATSVAQQADPTYQQLKDLQGLFPIPTPTATVQVGTFDQTSGNFTGLKSTPETINEGTGTGGGTSDSDPTLPSRKPHTILIPPRSTWTPST